MKTTIFGRRLPRAAALLALVPLLSSAVETASAGAKDQSDGPPTHFLFTGTDIKVLHDGLPYRVRDVEGGGFVIRVKDKDVRIPMGTNPEKLKITQVQTLTDHSATVANFKYERAYTPANDPYRKWSRGALASGVLREQGAFAETTLRGVPQQIERTQIVDGRPVRSMVDNLGVSQANEQLAISRQTAVGVTEFYENERGTELAKELFDAVEVQFEVSSHKPIHSPYVVIMAKYHEKDDPKHPQNWLFAKTLEPIGSQTHKVTVREGGFPPGFVVDKLQVHLYERGLEIATDLSENRAPLTRDEAHEYFVINHVSMHKTDTLPARVALTKMPEDWATHPKDESFRKTYYVKVDETGHPAGSFEDEACQTKVGDSYYESVLSSLLFLPALEHGKAVDGVARVKLTELPM